MAYVQGHSNVSAAPAAFGWIKSVLASVGDTLMRLSEASRVSHEISHLLGMSDADLKARGITRDQIPHMVAMRYGYI